VDPEGRGSIELELGLFDDLIRRQTVEIDEPVQELGSGLTRLLTRYTIEFSDFERPVDIREPD
jgi:hypothetical protein